MASPSVTYTFSNSTTADATQVNQNFTDLINGVSDGTKDLSISALTCAGNVTLNGNTTIGNASSDTLTVTASLASTVNIGTTFSYDLGSTTIGLRDVFFGSADSAARTTKIRAGTVASSNTLTLPIATGTLGLSINDLTAETAVVMANDLVKIYDASATAERKMTVDNLLGGVRPVIYVDKNSTDQTGIANGVITKVTWGRELIDSNGNFASSTFTPTVAGYYLIIAAVGWVATVDTSRSATYIYKNGAAQILVQTLQSTNQSHNAIITAILYANGSTDYFDIYGYQATGSNQDIAGNNAYTYFMAARLV